MLSKLTRTFVAASATFLILAPTAFAQAGAKPTAQASGPALKIATPQEGQTLYGDTLPVLLTVENFKLVDYQTAKTRVAGQGHIHLWLDDAKATKESAVKISSDSYTYSNVPAGEHTLKAELVANDHSSLRPPITATANFKTAPVSPPSPTATSGFDKNTALVILIVVALVILAAWWYTKEEDIEVSKSERVKEAKKPTRKASARRKK